MFILKVASALEKYKVPYVIVGGHAVALHGAVRGTVDIDVIIQWSLDNLQLLEKALGEMGLTPRLPLGAEDVFRLREKYIKDKNMVAWNFVNTDNPMEQVDLIITMDRADVSSCHFKVGDTILPVIGKKDLILMKRQSGREQDRVDAEALERLDEN